MKECYSRKAIAVAYEQRNYELINQIARIACNTESLKYFYKLVLIFSRNRNTQKGWDKFGEACKILNRENSLIVCKEPLKDIYSDLFIHMIASCRLLNSKLIRIGDMVKDIKDKSKIKWINRDKSIARKFHDEEYEHDNLEAREIEEKTYEKFKFTNDQSRFS
jgi:hypothetical protein